MYASTAFACVLFQLATTTDPNIALNKPCIQSGTYIDNAGTYTCSFAVDGSRTTISSATELQDEPYWQLDLQGYYIVSNISVSSDDSFWSVSINNAKIAITTNDMVCNNGKVFECGQWPNTDHRDQTLVFTCTDVTPVRYIRVWREESGYLVIRELEVKGEPWKTFGMSFERVESTQLSTPVSTLSVSYKAECATACYETQPCIAFSYSSSESPNCILASHQTNTSEAVWDTYTVDECFGMDTC